MFSPKFCYSTSFRFRKRKIPGTLLFSLWLPFVGIVTIKINSFLNGGDFNIVTVMIFDYSLWQNTVVSTSKFIRFARHHNSRVF